MRFSYWSSDVCSSDLTTDHRSFIMGITTIKPSQLRLSPLNQRRVKPSAVEAMADDIAAHGLLQNLVAYEDEGLFYVRSVERSVGKGCVSTCRSWGWQ